MNIGTLTVTLGADLSGLDQMTKGLNTMAQRMRTFGYLSSLTLTAPMVMAGKAAFNMAKDFEYSIQKIVGLAGVAQESVNKWRDAILKMSPEVAQTPQALADALYYIASSGIKGADALDVLRQSALAAKAGLGETKAIADYLTSALNAYRGSGLTAAYATDVLVAAVREGKAEATGFAAQMGSLIPLASHLKVSLDQVAGVMAAITLTGSTAAQASTYLRSLFTVLSKKDEYSKGPGADALKALGTSYGELRRILASGPEGLIKLMQKFRDMTDQYGETLVGKVIPNVRGMMSIFSLAGKNFQYNTELMKRVTAAHGSLAVAIGAVSNTIKVQLDTAVAKAQVALISFGKSISPTVITILNALVKELEKLTKWWNSLSKEQQEHKLKILAVIAVLGPLSLLISTVIYSISGLVGVLKILGSTWNFMIRQVIIGDIWKATKAAFQGVVFGAQSVTGAFAGTALAAERMALRVAVAGGSLLAFGTVLFFILPIYKKLWDKIQEMKAATDEMKATVDYISPAMELDKEIGALAFRPTGPNAEYNKSGSYINNIKNLNDQQLSLLKDKVVQRIALAQEEIDRINVLTKKDLENEKFVLDRKKELAYQEALMEEAKSKLRRGVTTPAEFKTWIKNIEIEKQTIQNEADIYIKNRQHEIDVTKDLQENTIDYNKSILNTAQIVSAYRQTVIDDMAAAKEMIDSQKTAADNLGLAWQQAGNLINDAFDLIKKGMNKDFWTMLTPPSQKNVLTDNLGMGFMSRSKQSTGGFMDQLNPTLGSGKIAGFMPSTKGAYTETSKVMQELAQTLDFITIKEDALGITLGKHRQLFDSVRAKVSAYSKALEDYLEIPVSQRGASWQKEVDATINNLERMQKEFEKIQTMKDFLTGIQDSFTEFFTNIIGGTKNITDAFKDMTNSIIQSFARLVGEMIAKGIMKLLLSIVSSGASGAGGFLSKFGTLIPNMAMGRYASGTNYASGGWSLVGENGPELMNVPKGAQILPHSLSNLAAQTISFEPVELVIKDNTLTGFIRKANKKNSLY